MKSLIKKGAPKLAPKQEQGVALVLSLMMGVLLMGGTSALVLRQIMARKLGASESYQQLAENAAMTGLNRIMGELNSPNGNQYLGYLYAVQHHNGADPNKSEDDQWGWMSPGSETFPLSGVCTELLDAEAQPRRITVDPKNQRPASPEVLIQQPQQITSLREQDLGNIETYYRLRSYKVELSNNSNVNGAAGELQIEGIVKRSKSNNEQQDVAKSLLLRTIYVRSAVAGDQDWSVIAAKNLSLNNTQITGPGLVTLNLDDNNLSAFQSNGGCEGRLESIDAASGELTADQVWPKKDNDLPSSNILFRINQEEFNNLNSVDTIPEDKNNIRIWAFDDSTGTNWKAQTQEGNINENQTEETITISPLPCGEIVCTRPNLMASEFKNYQYNPEEEFDQFIDTQEERDQEISQANFDTYIQSKETPYTAPDELTLSGNTILLTEDDLCTNSANEKECHVYIERFNLNQTVVRVEAKNRPIILHLEPPETCNEDSSRCWSNLATYQIKATGTSQLCAFTTDSSQCDLEKPDQFVITADNSRNMSSQCPTSLSPLSAYPYANYNTIVAFEGASIPAGLIKLSQGAIYAIDSNPSNVSTFNGLLWANTICANNLTLNTANSDGRSFVNQANSTWGWIRNKGYSGYGREIYRGIRGSKLDTFIRW